MVEGDGLENRCTRMGTVGSNPTLSAIFISHFEVRFTANRGKSVLIVYVKSYARYRGIFRDFSGAGGKCAQNKQYCRFLK